MMCGRKRVLRVHVFPLVISRMDLIKSGWPLAQTVETITVETIIVDVYSSTSYTIWKMQAFV